METEYFKIMISGPQLDELTAAHCPVMIPMEMIAEFADQAAINHGGQTLEQLNSRGGLSPGEALAVLNRETKNPVSREDDLKAAPELYRILMLHHGNNDLSPPVHSHSGVASSFSRRAFYKDELPERGHSRLTYSEIGLLESLFATAPPHLQTPLHNLITRLKRS